MQAIGPSRYGERCEASVFPRTEEEWKTIAQTYEQKWNFPHCLGAVDGKHINIVPPPNSGSFYWNYKGRHSIVLMAIVNANYEFIMCGCGTNGRVSDGGVIENTLFYDKLMDGTLQLPSSCKTDDSNEPLSYVFIGDEAFALRDNFLKPFSQKELNRERRIFNYRLSRARRCPDLWHHRDAYWIAEVQLHCFLDALGGGAASIAKAVNDAKASQAQLAEQKRHNIALESVRKAVNGKGFYLAPFKKTSNKVAPSCND
ncbi:unnamed protein product, partial [Callosobruchus maculatus]